MITHAPQAFLSCTTQPPHWPSPGRSGAGKPFGQRLASYVRSP